MSTYGRFEAIEEIFPGRAGSIFLARSADEPATRYAIKTFNPPASVLGASAAEQSLKRFLVRAQLQQNLGELPGSMWAPILQTGRVDSEGFYVTRHYPRSIQTLIGAGVRLPEKGLHAVVTGVVSGLEQIRSLAARSHGNLKPGNILIDGRGLIQPRNIALTDPASDNIASSGGDAADLAAIGQLIHQIITRRDAYTGADWSAQGEREWAHLGPRAKQWRDFCRRLVDGNDDSPTFETLRDDLRKLRPPSRTVKQLPKMAAASALIAFCSFFIVRQNHQYRSQRNELADDLKEMQPAWRQIKNGELVPFDPVNNFFLTSDDIPPDSKFIVPFFSQEPAKLKPVLEIARAGTYSAILAQDEKDLRSQGLKILADGYRSFQSRLRPPPNLPVDTNLDNLIAAANLAVTHHGKIDAAVLHAGKSIDPAIVNPLQTRWINQLDNLANASCTYAQTDTAASSLETLPVDDAKTPEKKQVLRDAALLKNADTHHLDLTTTVIAWKAALADWAPVPPQPQSQLVSQSPAAATTLAHAPPNSVASSPAPSSPAPQDLSAARFESLKKRGDSAAAEYPEIESQLWTIAWDAARKNIDSYEALSNRFNQLREIFTQIQPPTIDCPIPAINDTLQSAFTRTTLDVYAKSLNFNAPQLPSTAQVNTANQLATAKARQVTDLFTQTSDFNTLISNGADDHTLKLAHDNLLHADFIRSDPALLSAWDAFLKTLTSRITDLPADPTSRWQSFTDSGDYAASPSSREIKLALLRTGISVQNDPKLFRTACENLKSEFRQPAPAIASQIDSLALQNWQNDFVSLCAHGDNPDLTHKILLLKNNLPGDKSPPAQDQYNLNLANLKQAAESGDTAAIDKAAAPLASTPQVAQIQSQMHPVISSPFKGPFTDKPAHLKIQKLDATSFKLALADQDFDDLTLKFERLNGNFSSTCLLSAEVSFKLFQRIGIAYANTHTPAQWQKLLYRTGQFPPCFWVYDDSDDGNANANLTLTVPPSAGVYREYYASRFPTVFQPNPSFPMQRVSVKIAMEVAAALHCRLPTQAEWQEALIEDQASPQPNATYLLRGKAWVREDNFLRAEKQRLISTDSSPSYQNNLNSDFPIRIFEKSIFTPSDLTSATPHNFPLDNTNLFFRETGTQPGRFSDLIGNVAEYVTTSTNPLKIAVIGGSGMSPSTLDPTRAYPLTAASGFNINTTSFTDVGFRLAYDDAVPTPLSEIQKSIAQIRYMPVSNLPVTSASTPPPNAPR